MGNKQPRPPPPWAPSRRSLVPKHHLVSSILLALSRTKTKKSSNAYVTSSSSTDASVCLVLSDTWSPPPEFVFLERLTCPEPSSLTLVLDLRVSPESQLLDSFNFSPSSAPWSLAS